MGDRRGVTPQRTEAGFGERLGLFDAGDFDVVDGEAAARSAGEAAAWYFAGETVAVPCEALPVGGFSTHLRAFNDVRRWNDDHARRAPPDRPPLVWLAAPHRWRHARVDAAAGVVHVDGQALPFDLVARHRLNRSWFDASSAAYFASQPAVLRGTLQGRRIEVRTLWPEAFRLGPSAPQHVALPEGDTPGEQLRALVRAPVPADACEEAVTLWQRANDDGRWTGRAVLALLLNGAQGDDDESHGGHFAIATGRVASDGAIGDWLVANFYALDAESEKGILPAPVPLDNYQGDLNAGQSWYRPSWLLAAVLDDDRAAVRVQSALHRVHRQFWRHQLGYYHPAENCTSFSVDTLEAVGLAIAPRGPSSRTVPLWFPALVARERSVAKAKVACDYLMAERTRLLPALAFEAAFEALWALAHGAKAVHHGPLGRELAQDLRALAFARLPQFPSSRVPGAPPVVSLAEYRARLPADPAKRQIVPVPARPFPDALRDPDLLPRPARPSDRVARAWTFGPLALAALGLVITRR